MGNTVNSPENYKKDRLMQYHSSVAAIGKLLSDGQISAESHQLMLDALAVKYGLEKNSIYAV